MARSSPSAPLSVNAFEDDVFVNEIINKERMSPHMRS